MLNEWTDRMESREASRIWRLQTEYELTQRVKWTEREMRQAMVGEQPAPVGFYDAMRHFLALREKLFPGLSADPAWKILVTLAQTPEGSDKASVTGVAYGADVPLTTVLRYLAVMEESGIIERIPNRSDRRQIMIRLTAEGRRRLDQIASKWKMRLLLTLVAPAALFYLAHLVA